MMSAVSAFFSPYPLQTLGSRVCGVQNSYNTLLAKYCLDSELRLGIQVVPLDSPTRVVIMVVH